MEKNPHLVPTFENFTAFGERHQNGQSDGNSSNTAVSEQLLVKGGKSCLSKERHLSSLFCNEPQVTQGQYPLCTSNSSCYCIQNTRFRIQDGWRLRDLSLSLNGNIAVTGFNENTDRTYIDLYSNVRLSDSRDKAKIIYSKEFEKYSDGKWVYIHRLVSLIDEDVLVSCLGDKLEVFQANKDEVLRYRRVNGEAWCLSVRERREIFIGFEGSNKITVYNVIDLNEIKSIILQGIQDGDHPRDITAAAGKLFCCVGQYNKDAEHKSLIFEETSGRILSELTKPTDLHGHPDSTTVTLDVTLGAVVWHDSFDVEEGRGRGKRCKIVFYSLSSESNCSFLIVEDEYGVNRIRISHRGDNIITGNHVTGEVKVYNMAEVFTYRIFKEKLVSSLQTDECTRLVNFFEVTKDQSDTILCSETPSENLLLALEEYSILQPRNVNTVIAAFDELRTNPFCRHVAEIFRKTRSPSIYKEAITKPEEETKTFRMTSEDEGKEFKAPWTLHKAPGGRNYYYNSATGESKWEKPETGQRAESQNKSEGLYLNISPNASEFLEQSSFEGEFAKFVVRVSEKLTKANCVKLATYFNFPAAKIEQIRNDFETPGITLFDILKERHIVNIHDVKSLREALEELELKDISDTLVTPYQKKIDRLRFEQQYLSQ